MTIDEAPPARARGRLKWLAVPLAALLAVLLWQQPELPGKLWGLLNRPAVVVEQRPPAAPADPFVTPDFLDAPPTAYWANPEEAGKAAHQTAVNARKKIDALWKTETAKITWRGMIVPVAAEARTRTQVDRNYFEYRLRELEAYRRLTKDAGPAKAAGETFLLAYLKKACERSDAEYGDVVHKLGVAALEAGCRDPLLRTYAAFEKFQLDADKASAEAVWRETLVEVRESEYPRIVSLFVRAFLDATEKARPSSPPQQRFPALVGAVVRWLEDDVAHPEWRQSVYIRMKKLWDNVNFEQRRMLLAACFASDKVDPWLVHTLAGEYYLEAGWKARGSGYASAVAESAWPEFERLMKQAGDHFQYAWLLDPNQPMAAADMITVAKAGYARIGREYEWFVQAVDAQLDYWDAYTAMQDALLPRWGGSLPQMIEFAQHCLDTDRFDTTVPYHVIEILLRISERELEAEQSLVRDLEVQPLLRQFVTRRERYRKQHPDEPLYGDSAYYRTRLGLMLEQCELPAEAAAEFIAADNHLEFATLQFEGRMGKHLMWRLLAAQGDVRDRVMALDEQLRQPWSPVLPVSKVDELERELQALKEKPASESAHWYFDSATRMVEQLRGFSAGDWVSMPFGPWAPGWEIHADEWFWNDDDPNQLTVSQRWAKQTEFWVRPVVNLQPRWKWSSTSRFSIPLRIPAPSGCSGRSTVIGRRSATPNGAICCS